LYGLLESQYGDRKDMLDIGVTVDDFMRKYFSFRHDFLGVVAAVNVGFALLFALVSLVAFYHLYRLPGG
jgi:hypothetical protein